ncbi:MAG TPA: DUF3563 family protein [Casimicrobiaceae bacterium]|jgi:hypothetical protein|nr:DUF3563 family protein [Casimicrobiaceae bacterium]
MTTRHLPYRNSPLGHLAFLVSEALRRPAADPKTAPRLGLLDRLDRWTWKQRQKDIEARLAQSTDLADLERRLRELDRAIVARAY